MTTSPFQPDAFGAYPSDDPVQLAPSTRALMKRVLARCRSEQSLDQQTMDWISQDPCLSSHVLRAVNSTVNGFPRQMTSVQQSLRMMGRHYIQRLMADAQGFSSPEEADEDDAPLQALGPTEAMGALANKTAVFSEKLAEFVGDVSPEDAFSAGLLHNIGDYAKQGQFPVLSQDDIQAMESVAVGHMLAEQWHFSHALRAVIQYQDRPHAAPDADSEVKDLVMVVAIAKRLVRDMNLSPAMFHWLMSKKPNLARDGEEFCEWRERFVSTADEHYEQLSRRLS